MTVWQVTLGLQRERRDTEISNMEFSLSAAKTPSLVKVTRPKGQVDAANHKPSLLKSTNHNHPLMSILWYPVSRGTQECWINLKAFEKHSSRPIVSLKSSWLTITRDVFASKKQWSDTARAKLCLSPPQTGLDMFYTDGENIPFIVLLHSVSVFLLIFFCLIIYASICLLY